MTRLRIASHVHSQWSYDGRWTLEQISEAFGRRRYDAVLLAEHDRGFDARRWAQLRAACAAVNADGAGAHLVPGIEYSDPTNTVHIPVWGDIPFLGEGLDTADLLAAAGTAGGIAVLAHPGRRDAGRRLDPALLRQFTGIEIWNRKYDGYAPSRAAATLVRATPGAIPMASLDFHTPRQFHPLAMLVDLPGEATERDICAALAARRARPAAFRLPATSLTRPPAWQTLRAIELARKRVAKRLKPLLAH
jgi:hypothetical protein